MQKYCIYKNNIQEKTFIYKTYTNFKEVKFALKQILNTQNTINVIKISPERKTIQIADYYIFII